MKSYTLTHKGRLGLCPVYIGDIDTECPIIVPRHWLLKPLMALSEVLCIWAMQVTGNYEWPIYVSGELRRPIRRKQSP